MSTADALDTAAREHRFSGVVAELGGGHDLVRAYGLAHRSTGTPVAPDTRFPIASGSKGVTALVVAALAERGALALDSRARELLGADLPLIDDAVTVRHLLTHTSGIGDYLDEETWEAADHVLTRPAHAYRTTADFLGDLAGHPQVSEPGARFAYCNGAFVVLALLAERASGEGFHDLARTLVLEPAGMTDSGFFPSDRLPERTALGYLGEDDDAVSHVFHLPVLGNGDGGLYSTAADLHRFWTALLAGRVVGTDMLDSMLAVHAEVPDDPDDYGLGFWLRPRADGDGHDPSLLGQDAGVSFVTRHDRKAGVTRAVLCGTTDGAWAMWDALLD